MGLKTAKRDIAGMEVRTQQFPALRSLNLVATLGRVTSGPLAKLAGMVEGKAVGDLDVSQAADALSLLFQELDGAEAQSLTKEVLASTSVVVTDDNGEQLIEDLGKPGAIDRVFTGKLLSMFKVMAFALEVNFGDFFGELGSSMTAKEE